MCQLVRRLQPVTGHGSPVTITMAITPYHPRFKKVSRRELALLEALYAYLPEGAVRGQIIEGIRDSIARQLGEGFMLQLEAVRQERFDTFAEKLPKHPLIALFRIEPHEGCLICEIDAMLAIMAVERMLGGQMESLPEPRPLSETEQGVLEYLLLQILARVHEQSGGDARVHLRFDRFTLDSDRLQKLAPGEADVATLVFRATLGRHAGFIRMSFTEPFVQEALANVEAPDLARPLEHAARLLAIKRFFYVKTPLWAEAGRTTLLPADLRQLEEGDVVLLEQGDLRLSEGSKEGAALLRVGQGAEGGIDVEVTLTTSRAACRVRGIQKGA